MIDCFENDIIKLMILNIISMNLYDKMFYIIIILEK